MRLTCPCCGAKCIVSKTNKMSLEYSESYASCAGDIELCGWRGVISVAYKHTLTPSRKETSDIIYQLAAKLAPDTRKQIQAQLALL
ncbi:ogr/Delta-like zinc finger family protein [Photobacterium phosphoreum]|uniref:ogr/Delta-like zinc finger family protein n=1 Tax=Photobacterium phosphoreum TaxID=659 RepID=UPI000D16148D|nr:transcriptional regulator [Photobacterium phosphoreum]